LAKRIAENVPKNFKEILTDTETAISDYEGSNYFDFGNQIGSVLVLAIGSDPAANVMHN